MADQRSASHSERTEHEPVHEIASAKVNLTLEIKGKRAEGYHEIESLVVFADFGDQLSWQPATYFSLSIDGPFGYALDQPQNLIEVAASSFAAQTGIQPMGAFHLNKQLPIAAGLGGGSADAAAALRILQRMNGTPEMLSDLIPSARNIGADVPCCLFSRAAVMTGIGEILHPLAGFEPIPAVLVNPMQPLPTAPVFRALAAEALPATVPPFERSELSTLNDVLAYARARHNDLETPARALLPVIDDVMAALRSLPGALLTRLSGSGPSCFALFAEMEEAEAAASQMAAAHPDWWVQPVQLR